jgi:outer membrane protein TolC
MMFVVLALQPAKSQVGDSLTLTAIIGEVVQNHPAVKKAMEDINVSEAKIGFAKSGNLPTADFSSSYSRLGPTSEITIPGMGSFSIMSPNNYNAAVSVNQMLYDFGKTANNVQFEKQGKELAVQSVEAVRQKLSQAVVASYYSLLYLQEAIKIKDEQLKNLNEHLQSVKKKQETGSATQYEILTTQVRISAIENQKTDLETARKIQICQLNSMLGKPESTMVQVKKELLLQLPEKQTDGLIAMPCKTATR